MHSGRLAFGLFPLLLTALAPAAHAQVALPGVFGSHMVLQRDMAVPVWGTANPGEKVTVTFRNQEKTATADAGGRWQVKLDPLTAGGPDKLTVSGSSRVEFDDVLVGEVWVGSGQSNMRGGGEFYLKTDEAYAAAVAAAPYPKIRFFGYSEGRPSPWREATAKNIAGASCEFSALLFCFGLRLHKELDVPVGLVLSAHGATASSQWLSQEALKSDPACQDALQKFYDAAMKKFPERIGQWELAAAAARERKQPEPPRPAPPTKPEDLKVGNLYEVDVRPLVGYGIRGVLWDQGEGNTGLFGLDQYTLMGALIGGWRREWGQGDFPFVYVQKPSGGGCAWDTANPVTKKGEAFAPLPDKAPNAGEMFDSFIRMMAYPNTGMAISSDLGAGIHPENKSGYAHRAADVALGMAYGRKVEYYGPVYASHKVNGGEVRVSFTHVGQGLAFRHGDRLQGFALAGADRKFQWAEATIDGDVVVLKSPQVSQPVHVRYAWADKRCWANLFNKDGLPAVPFRTDP